MAVQIADRPGPRRISRSFTPASAGRELDLEIERRVFRRAPGRALPPFSTEDWTATALAELVARQTGWSFELSEQDGVWTAIWIEHSQASAKAPTRILSLFTASAPTRALAISRALLKAARSPRWCGVAGALAENRG